MLGLTPAPEVLVGAEDALELYARAEPLGTEQAAGSSSPHGPINMVARERVGAVILAPAPGLVLRERDRVTVSADTPLNSEVILTVNGEPVAAETIGKRVADPNLNRQTYDFIGVPLQPGPNVLRLESALKGEVSNDSVTVYFSGPAAGFTLTALTPLVADSATPLALDLVVVDAWGNATPGRVRHAGGRGRALCVRKTLPTKREVFSSARETATRGCCSSPSPNPATSRSKCSSARRFKAKR